ncbi:type IX secretion system membrane protein, PorP/SprF family [Muriicola jejuensis]|uniref:Type IX secretion system membrane protein PorP/SprF n=1 Tax=Muriicola jejuensis TaxID=504488 RepID=A0A6P0UD17_9FLAO|nr:type IX secretion system membrane protein PorP/SprF [Muriicola jejuensis]NER09183.1 type IX secretion system membrane protein PorP/SprF [Muriicola jejuensis]SMP10518.1 type IX secretion system membrane protein, PorP/SprF family [Muriicola jejuensis]
MRPKPANTIITNIVRSSLPLILLCFSLQISAQQDAQYTQYMYNTVSVNPGYAGSRGHLSIAALYRAQWVGLEGAPKTQTFNFHTPVGYRGVGMGLSIVNDQIGPTSETYFDVDFSYTIQLAAEKRLSFGLKGSVHMLDIRFSELNQDWTNPGGPDPTLQQDIQNKLSPNIGAGIYYHTDKYYLGLSVPRFLQTSHFEESSLSTATEQMNFYLITGYVFQMNPLWKFKPTLLSKVVQGAPLQVDVSANFMYNDKFIMGAAYRWDAAVSAMAGFQLSPEFLIGMAYDREITELGTARFNDGSFEIILRYDFIKVKDNLKSPRFF